MRIARNCYRREHENDGQAREKDVQRDLVRRLLALGALDQRDHAVEEGRALRRGDAHLQPIGDDERAAGDRRAIAARLTDDRRRFAGDRRFIDRGHALDHFAVGGNEIARLDQNDLSRPKLACRSRHDQPLFRIDDELGHGLLARPTQGCRLCFTATFGHGLGEIGEQHGEPQPDDDLELEAEMLASRDEIADKNDCGQRS